MTVDVDQLANEAVERVASLLSSEAQAASLLAVFERQPDGSHRVQLTLKDDRGQAVFVPPPVMQAILSLYRGCQEAGQPWRRCRMELTRETDGWTHAIEYSDL